jgi:hypothetical protein
VRCDEIQGIAFFSHQMAAPLHAIGGVSAFRFLSRAAQMLIG